MSKSTDHPAHGEDDASRDENRADPAVPRRLYPFVVSDWLSAGHQRFTQWVATTLTARDNDGNPFLLDVTLPVIDRLAGIGIGLISMVIVDRHYGPSGMGIFAWFFSMLTIAGYLGRFGLPAVVENQIARHPPSAPTIGANALAALLALGLGATAVGALSALVLTGPGPGSADNFLILIVGPTILFQNISALRVALLNGNGRHRAAVGLRIRQRVVFVVLILVLCHLQVPVPLLAGAFLVSQIIMVVWGRKAQKLPTFSNVFAGCRQISTMLARGRAFLFTDNVLDVVFYVDMLILGWFVNPTELGIYARALILARLFLVLPTGFRPVVRRLANQWAAAGRIDRLRRFMIRSIRLLFGLHGLAAIIVLVNFFQVLDWVFSAQQWMVPAFAVFALVLPGLIFYSAIAALEPVFEAIHQPGRLRRMIVTVAAVNLVLNINLIPFAGLDGAALATAGAMVVHYFLFCRSLPTDLRGIGLGWSASAAVLYLTYVVMAWLEPGMLASFLVAPVLFGGLLSLTGFFSTPSASR